MEVARFQALLHRAVRHRLHRRLDADLPQHVGNHVRRLHAHAVVRLFVGDDVVGEVSGFVVFVGLVHIAAAIGVVPAVLLQQLPRLVQIDLEVGGQVRVVHPRSLNHGRVRPVNHAHVDGLDDGINVDAGANRRAHVVRHRAEIVVQQQALQLIRAVGDGKRVGGRFVLRNGQ